MTHFLPRYFTSKAIALYIVLLVMCSVLLIKRVLPAHWIAFGVIEVISFFYFSNFLTKKWADFSSNIFTKKLFQTAFIVRFLYVLFSYYFYLEMTGKPFEFAVADAKGYHEEAIWLLHLLKTDQLPVYFAYKKGALSDMGYVVYLTFIYSIFGSGLLLVRFFKAALSAYTCVLVYKIASRNFGENSGKIAGILCLLSPNLIYYCGLHLKETEMVFLTILFIERADVLIRSKEFSVKALLILLMIGSSLFFFRTVLGVTAFASLLIGFLLYRTEVGTISPTRKAGFIIVMIGLLTFLQGGRLESEVTRYWGDRDANQRLSMRTRSRRATGNKLAIQGSTAVFAPLILMAPFPTLINIQTQQNQMLLNGGYYTRNIYVFFLFIALAFLVKNKKVREHLLIISFLLSYLAVLALSKFAISERFHLPIVPIIIILAAFGITQLNRKNVKYYVPYLLLIGAIIIAWNMFKVAGRGGI